MANVRRHLANRRAFGVPCVVAVNRRPGDTNEEVELRQAPGAGGRRVRRAEANEGFAKGGAGAADLAAAVVDACDEPSELRAALRADDCADPGQDRGHRPARLRRRRRLLLPRGARRSSAQYTADGLGQLPDLHGQDPPVAVGATRELLNAPEHFTLPVRDIRAYTGAGWLVPLCGDISRCPGLGKTPAALNIDIDDERAHGRACSERLVASYHPPRWQRSPLPVGRRRACPGRRWSTSPRRPCAGWLATGRHRAGRAPPARAGAVGAPGRLARDAADGAGAARGERARSPAARAAGPSSGRRSSDRSTRGSRCCVLPRARPPAWR